MQFDSKILVKKQKLINKLGEDKYEEVTKVFNLLREQLCSVVKAQINNSRQVIINEIVTKKCISLKLDLNNLPPEVQTETDTIGNVDDRKRKHSVSLEENESDVENADRSNYEKWKDDHLKLNVPVVSLKKFMLLINELEEKTDGKSDSEILRRCVALQQTPFNNHYDSPGAIVRLLRTCVITRNWDNMTHLLLIFLKYGRRDAYIEIIRHMCELLCQFHPLAKENGLDEQFKIILETRLKKQDKNNDAI